MCTKRCSRCGLDKDEAEFRWKNKKRGERVSMCRPCDRDYRAKRYQEHREHILQTNLLSRERRRDRIATQGLSEPETRRCIDCLEVKPSASFRWSSKGHLRRIPRCKECDALHLAADRQENKGRYVASKRRQYRALRDLVDQHKVDPCLDCGQSFPTYVMDFDHRDPTTKISKVSQLVYSGSSVLVLAEIAKCDLVCSNCHRIRTHTRSRHDQPS